MELTYSIDTPLPRAGQGVDPGEAGTFWVLEGWAFCREQRIESLVVHFKGQQYAVREFGNARKDVLLTIGGADSGERVRALRSGFWVVLPVPADDEARAMPFRLAAHLKGGGIVFSGEHVLHVAGRRRSVHRGKAVRAELPVKPRVCICLATYNPGEAVFRRQVDSIRAQEYDNWICLVQDDTSSYESYRAIRAVLGNDERFILERNEWNLGFYLNFERVLRRVPADCDLVCLSDQDDRWNPDKVSALVAGFSTPDTTLVYSDMRIVDDNGTVLSNTYWSMRRNNYTDLEALFFANTITGAASMFKTALLPSVLPFPPKLGQVFHDWWIGLVALATGRVRYVDRPLYDYYQHGENALGWCSQIASPVFAGQIVRSGAYRRKLAHTAWAMYNFTCKYLAVSAAILRERVPYSPQEEAIERVAGILNRPLRTMAGQMLRSKWHRRASESQERNVFLAYGVSRLLNHYFAWKSPGIVAGSAAEVEAHKPVVENQVLAVDTFERKSEPLKLEIDPGEKCRVNMLLPMIDFRYFFGGYIGKFQLAKRLAKAGHQVRLVIVEHCTFEPEVWREKIKKFAGLEDIFDLVEVAYHFDRSRVLVVNPKDRFISTTCWNAWIADAAARRLQNGPFVALIQEYEPFVVPHGSLYALSHAAYELDLFGIFSTELLRDFFRVNRLGPYRDGAVVGDARSISFHNAITPFKVEAEHLRAREGEEGKRKFLFYCRPEEHAQRNMFEMGVLALREALRRGTLNPERWEFYGIGTIGARFSIPLHGEGAGGGTSLHALPRTSLEDYTRYLPDFDVGMSLMYTPHPSLVPLEMAGAGLVTVTNSFANKTAEALQAISPNFEVAPATVAELAEALARAEARVGDYAARAAGAQVNWPTSWEQAFAPDVMQPLLNELAQPRAVGALKRG